MYFVFRHENPQQFSVPLITTTHAL